MNKPPIDTSPQAVLRRRYKALRDEGYNEDFCRFAKVAADSLDAKDVAIDMLTGERDALAAKVAALEATLQQAISCIDPTDGARYEHAYVNGLHLLSARSGAETPADDTWRNPDVAAKRYGEES